MVEVRFAFIGSIEGVKCVLDGVTKYSDSGGFCRFFGISQGAHTYSVSKDGYTFIEGQDPFNRPLYESGTTTIEWAPVPGIPWPEDQPWLMLITLEEEVPVGIPTTTTISAPSKAAVNEKFNISGILYETEAGIPIPNQSINHSYDGRSIGSSMTGVDGGYLKEVSVSETGVWMLKSVFPGTEGLQASRALAGTVVAATPIATALLIAGPIAMGIALFIYGIR